MEPMDFAVIDIERLSQSRLVRLPTELLLTIVRLLCETNIIPYTDRREKEKPAFSPSAHLHSLSLVCKRLCQLCLSPLFSRVKITHTYHLQRSKDKCAIEPEFACLIRQLDLAHVHSPEEQESRRAGKTYRYGPDILPVLFPYLKSLEWLALDMKQIDANLLTTINSHPKLVTVTTCDRDMETLRTLFSSTLLQLLLGRSLRVVHLVVRDDSNIRVGPGALDVPGLETLDIGVYADASSMSWLPAFVERRTNLQVIKFSGDGSVWRHNPDITFPSQFIDALEQESLTRAVDLSAFSISRISATSSLDDWQVAYLEMEITKGAGVSALAIASSIAPHISSLNFQMSRRAMELVHIDDLLSSLCLFRSLRKLELHRVYRRIACGGEVPWDLPPSNPVRPTSKCANAHAALRWLTGCVVQRTPSLDLVHITDQGCDSLNHHSYPWALQVTYRVQQNRDLELHGTPRLVAGYQFSKPSCTIDPSSQPVAVVLESSTPKPRFNTCGVMTYKSASLSTFVS
ncbi:hypothetical protein MVEN_01035200 [Mycena venus]|uniref:F-box domain-containing protein n=1 Tax=Mycena venus TaxID=2733690 RepID=A0A8H6Y9Q6_9AGAR|nr:hypothetical protein MVEN_01035200 [Mycena venus]